MDIHFILLNGLHVSQLLTQNTLIYAQHQWQRHMCVGKLNFSAFFFLHFKFTALEAFLAVQTDLCFC